MSLASLEVTSLWLERSDLLPRMIIGRLSIVPTIQNYEYYDICSSVYILKMDIELYICIQFYYSTTYIDVI